MRLLVAACLSLLIVGGAAAQTSTQQTAQSVVRTPILTIDSEQFFISSDFGQNVRRAIAEEGQKIADENARIEEELTTEERALTEARKDLTKEEFSSQANAFDEKVQAIRKAREDRLRALNVRDETARRNFLSAARPVLAQIMVESGAAVIVERRNVFVSADAIDITQLAIDRMNAAIGTGTGAVQNAPPATDGATDAPAAAE